MERIYYYEYDWIPVINIGGAVEFLVDYTLEDGHIVDVETTNDYSKAMIREKEHEELRDRFVSEVGDCLPLILKEYKHEIYRRRNNESTTNDKD